MNSRTWIILVVGLVGLALAACSETGPVDPVPTEDGVSDPGDPSPRDIRLTDDGLVTFIVRYPRDSMVVGVAPFNAPKNYRLMTARSDSLANTTFLWQPTFTPDKKRVWFAKGGSFAEWNLVEDEQRILNFPVLRFGRESPRSVSWINDSEFILTIEGKLPRAYRVHGESGAAQPELAHVSRTYGPGPRGTVLLRADSLLLYDPISRTTRKPPNDKLATSHKTIGNDLFAGLWSLSWSDDVGKFVGGLTSEMFVADTVSNEVQMFNSFDRYLEPRWGPGGWILYTRVDEGTQPSIQIVHQETRVTYPWLSIDEFPGANAVMSPDY